MTIKNYKQGIIKIIKCHPTNAAAERFNSLTQKSDAIAQGYRNFDNLRAAILVHNDKLSLASHC